MGAKPKTVAYPIILRCFHSLKPASLTIYVGTNFDLRGAGEVPPRVSEEVLGVEEDNKMVALKLVNVLENSLLQKFLAEERKTYDLFESHRQISAFCEGFFRKGARGEEKLSDSGIKTTLQEMYAMDPRLVSTPLGHMLSGIAQGLAPDQFGLLPALATFAYASYQFGVENKHAEPYVSNVLGAGLM